MSVDKKAGFDEYDAKDYKPSWNWHLTKVINEGIFNRKFMEMDEKRIALWVKMLISALDGIKMIF